MNVSSILRKWIDLVNKYSDVENKKENDNNEMAKNVITVEGNANDLFEISNNGEMKQTRLFFLLPESLEENSETLDLTITSTNPYHSFPIFDSLLDKKIRISVDIIGDEE